MNEHAPFGNKIPASDHLIPVIYAQFGPLNIETERFEDMRAYVLGYVIVSDLHPVVVLEFEDPLFAVYPHGDLPFGSSEEPVRLGEIRIVHAFITVSKDRLSLTLTCTSPSKYLDVT
jgi:hypothetical protein